MLIISTNHLDRKFPKSIPPSVFRFIVQIPATPSPENQPSSNFRPYSGDPLLTSKILTLLKQCCSINHLKQIHSQMIKNQIQKPNFFLVRLIELKKIDYASLFFDQIEEPNDFSWNMMIRGLTQTGNFSNGIDFYYRMKSSGKKPNNFTFPFVLISCANMADLNQGKLAHCCVFKSGLSLDEFIQHSLITMYSKCFDSECARQVFDEITQRDLVSWNSMISGYVGMGRPGEAVRLFRRTRIAGFRPDEMTVVSVLAACADLGDIELGRWIANFVGESGLELNSFVGSSLIDMYSKCGSLDCARKVFDGMLKRDLVAWNALITGYAQNGFSNEAITLFGAMRDAGIEPDKITMVGVLSACSSVGALDLGKWIDAYASKKGLRYDIYIGTGLIDMYAKCGSLECAHQVFNRMPIKNSVSWNAMISALAMHGRGKEALSLFASMAKDRIVHPNDITFVGVLSACVHLGLVDEGLHWFHAMEREFGLVPKIEHYSCIVDLLGRAGHLAQAWEFVEAMPGKPDAVVLGALLGACRNLENVDLGEQIAQRLLELEPQNSGNYVILSKMYANSERWEDSAKMRGLMRERKVVKTPGCSWIEIENLVHEFHAGDFMHFRSREIHEMIKILNEQMKLQGYKPNLGLLQWQM